MPILGAPALLNGTYDITASTIVGNFSTFQSGNAPTNIRINQNNWSIDRFDGAGPSGYTLNHLSGNTYQIRHDGMGFGKTSFAILGEDGLFYDAHEIKNTNNTSSLDIEDVALPYLAAAASLGTSDNVELKVGPAVVYKFFQANSDSRHRTIRAVDHNISGVGTSEAVLMSIRCAEYRNGRNNKTEILLKNLTISTEGTRPVIAEIYKNATLTNPQYSPLTSDVDFDTSATARTNGQFVLSFTAPRQGAFNEDLSDFKIELNRGKQLTIVVRTTANTADIAGSIVWEETI